jgi:hypothetical protein
VKIAVEKYGTNRYFPESPLYCAGKGGNIAVVEFLIEKGDINLFEGLKGAAEGGHKDLVDYFVAPSARSDGSSKNTKGKGDLSMRTAGEALRSRRPLVVTGISSNSS